jgi:DNA-binding beta-propeller fold protein YncE
MPPCSASLAPQIFLRTNYLFDSRSLRQILFARLSVRVLPELKRRRTGDNIFLFHSTCTKEYLMRLFGQHLSSRLSVAFTASAILAVATRAQAQTAPYIIPYTMSTYAGGYPAYTIGYGCGTAAAAASLGPGTVALDSAGDGCFAPLVSVGADPHDLRVDGTGNVFYIDATASSAVVHKINPFTQLETVYVGNLLGAKICTAPIAPSTKYGDGCQASDGVANSTGLYTLVLKNVRGLGVANNGDLFIAGYGDYYVHKIAQATGFMSLIAGNGTSPGGYAAGAPGTNLIVQARGVTADGNGNIYVMDTGNNAFRIFTLSTNSLALASNMVNTPPTTQTKNPANGAFSSAFLAGPEDAAIDSFGNYYIADASNAVVRAVYNGSGTLPGVTAPVTGQIYIVAGYYSPSATPNPNVYPTNGSIPELATTVTLSAPRKISLDVQNNLYIADAGANVVWFVDHATGYIRALAGSYGQPASYGATKPAYVCAAATNNIGDGCPATTATIYSTGTGGTAMGAMPDNQGNLYLSDAENSSISPTYSRIRKVLSGLNFPATSVNTAATPQTILVHFAANDTPAATNPFVLKATGTDFTLGAQSCTTNSSTATPAGDNTTDCTLALNFKPSVPGHDTAVLTITSKLGAVTSYTLSGTGTAAPAIAFDPGNTALLSPSVSNPQGIALDSQGNAYIADTANNRVLFYNAATTTTTVFAGTGTAGNTGNGGPATSATLNAPKAVTIDTSGSVYIADTGNNIIRKVNAAGTISLFAGGASAVCANPINTRGDGCPALQTTFNAPSGLAADYLGNLYVADTGNKVVRQISTNTNVLTLAANSTTTFKSPTGLAFDFNGKNLFVADSGSDNIYKINLGTTYTVTGTSTVSNIAINPITLVAGNGTAGSSIAASGLAVGSQLNAPTGVAVDTAGNLYIADTGNGSVRLVNAANGFITTIAGITASPGTGTIGGAATATQLTTPGDVTVSPLGTLFVLDSGNNRVIADTRSQITYNFGRTNQGFPSPVQNFTELNIGNASAMLPTPPQGTEAPVNTQFTLVSQANGTGIITGCNAGTFTSGSICNLQGQFTPTALGTETVVYTQTGTGSAGASAPSITLIGLGAVLTTTGSVVIQSSPVLPTQSQYGQSVTLATTITPVACNTAAPACYPSGYVNFLVDGSVVGSPVLITGSGTSTTLPLPATASQIVSGLAVGNHTISCNYLGDNFYAASTCPNVVLVVAQASTTSLLSATNSGQPQFPTNNCTQSLKTLVTGCTQSILTASVISNTIGTPTGTVTFYATLGTTTTTIATVALSGSPATSTFTINYCYDDNGATSPVDNKGNACNNDSLPPGDYTLTCKYNGAANFAISNCAGIPFVVLPEPGAIVIPAPVLTNTSTWYSGVKPCIPAQLYQAGTFTPVLGQSCPSISNTSTGVTGYTSTGTAVVAVAQGATNDATIFMIPSNALTGSLTFSCSGLPADSTCTFSPTSIPLTPGTGFSTPVYVDVTFWNDLQPGSVPGVGLNHSPTLGQSRKSAVYAEIIGWPLTFASLFLLLRLRRSSAALKLLAMLLLITGSALTFTGCAGPGDYKAVLTPTGTYPVTFTVTNGTVSNSVVIDYVVTPGNPSFE